MERVRLLLDSGPIDRLDFLGPSLFRSEDPAYEGWISLDFLGFSRHNLDLSIGYADKIGKYFLVRFWWRSKRSGRGPSVVGMRTSRICHAASLAEILIFLNRLSSERKHSPKGGLLRTQGRKDH